MFQMMASWRLTVRPSQLLKVQSALKMNLAIRRSVYQNLFVKWEKAELEITKELQQKGMTLHDIKEAFNIPSEVKKFVMRSRIKATINRHNMALVVNRFEVDAAYQQFKARRLGLMKAEGHQSEPYEELRLPPMPVMSLNFNLKIVKEMIMKAQNLKPYWRQIVTSLNTFETERELASLMNEQIYDSSSKSHSDSRTSEKTQTGIVSPSVAVRRDLLTLPQSQGTRRKSVVTSGQGSRRSSIVATSQRSRRNSSVPSSSLDLTKKALVTPKLQPSKP
jgi:hypothetical protein